MIPTNPEDLIFLALFGLWGFIFFAFGYQIRGLIEKMGGEVFLISQWWKKRREKRNAENHS